MAPPRRRSAERTVAREKLDAVERVTRDLGSCRDFHDAFVDRLQKNQEAYEAHLNIRSDANAWTSKLHPPWVNHIVETTIASLVDDKLAYRVKPRPRFYDPGEYTRVAAGARAHEILMQNQLAHDRFSETQRPLALQAAIAGYSVAKTYWKRELLPRKQLVTEHQPVMGEYGPTGLTIPILKVEEKVRPAYEGPTTEVVDVRDFFYHEAAVSEDRCRFFIHRVWMTLDELEKLQKKGFFKDVSKLKDKEPGDREPPETRAANEPNRTKDMFSVLEHWDLERRNVTWMVEDHNIVVREKEFPFWHNQHPFTIVSTQPQPFRLESMSQVEKLEHLQTALWDIMNQRIDNLRLVNNMIIAVRSDIEDLDSLVYEPGAKWPLDDISQVLPIQVNPLPAEVSLGAEQQIKQDMQNLAGSQPFTSTSEARNVGADTATEAALVSSIAQSSTKQMKTQLNYAYERIGQLRLELNQQFVRQPMYAEMTGLDNAQEILEILPETLQGEFKFDIAPMNESLMRQERRAEANTLAQILFQVAQPAAAMGVLMNARKIIEDLLEANDVQDKEAYFSGQPQPGVPSQGAPQGQSAGRQSHRRGHGAAEHRPCDFSVRPDERQPADDAVANMAFQGNGA